MVKFLITGHKGMLGSALMRQAKKKNLDVIGLGHEDMDITDEDSVATMAGAFGERTVINAAGIVRGGDENKMFETNCLGPRRLAKYFPRVVQISTDCVFDGKQPDGYKELDLQNADDTYGRSKTGGEIFHPPHLTIRGSFIGFGSGGFLDRMILSQEPDATINGFKDWRWNGLYVEVFAKLVLEMAQLPMTGVAHAYGETISKYYLLWMMAGLFRPDLKVVPTTGGSKDMILQSDVFTGEQFETMAGGSLKWKYMIRSMQDDYSHHPGRAVPGE